MAIIKRFCFCCTLRGGSMFVASYSLLSSAFFIALLLIRNIGYRFVDVSTIHKLVTYGSFVLFGAVMGTAIILIIGVHKNKKWLFIPWILTTITCHVFATVTVVWLVTLTIRDEATNLEGWEIGLLCYHAVNLIISTYCVICVFSHYQELTEGGTSNNFVHREYRRDLTLIFRERGSRSGLTNSALNSNSPRPPQVPIVTPPPYQEPAPPPPYSTFPRNMVNNLAPTRRSQATSNAMNSAAGGAPTNHVIPEENEDDLNEDIVGGASSGGAVSSATTQPSTSQGEPRHDRKPPTYRRILPETKLGRRLAEQGKERGREERGREERGREERGREERGREERGREVQAQRSHEQIAQVQSEPPAPPPAPPQPPPQPQPPQSPPPHFSSDEENTESDSESEESPDTLNQASDEHVRERSRMAELPSTTTSSPPPPTGPDTTSTDTSNRSSLEDNPGAVECPDIYIHASDGDGHTSEESQGNPSTDSHPNSSGADDDLEDEPRNANTFQSELSDALTRLRAPGHPPLNEQPHRDDQDEGMRERAMSASRPQDTSPRETRRDARKFATVSSSSRKIMDTTLVKAKENYRAYLGVHNRDVFMEENRRQPRHNQIEGRPYGDGREGHHGRHDNGQRYHERDERYHERDERYHERDERYHERDERYHERDDRRPQRDPYYGHRYYERQNSGGATSSGENPEGMLSSREGMRRGGDERERVYRDHAGVMVHQEEYQTRNHERQGWTEGRDRSPGREGHRKISPPGDAAKWHSSEGRVDGGSPRRERLQPHPELQRQYSHGDENNPPVDRYVKEGERVRRVSDEAIRDRVRDGGRHPPRNDPHYDPQLGSAPHLDKRLQQEKIYADLQKKKQQRMPQKDRDYDRLPQNPGNKRKHPRPEEYPRENPQRRPGPSGPPGERRPPKKQEKGKGGPIKNERWKKDQHHRKKGGDNTRL